MVYVGNGGIEVMELAEHDDAGWVSSIMVTGMPLASPPRIYGKLRYLFKQFAEACLSFG
jgi:hypothetical protein